MVVGEEARGVMTVWHNLLGRPIVCDGKKEKKIHHGRRWPSRDYF